MNKAYIDTPDVDSSNASLVYIPNNGEMFYNLLSTKFPEDSVYAGIWDNVWTDGANLKDKFVVWFTDCYSYRETVDDLSLFGFNVVKIPDTFDRLREMITYIEENNL